jgi:hypothetical protein
LQLHRAAFIELVLCADNECLPGLVERFDGSAPPFSIVQPSDAGAKSILMLEVE